MATVKDKKEPQRDRSEEIPPARRTTSTTATCSSTIVDSDAVENKVSTPRNTGKEGESGRSGKGQPEASKNRQEATSVPDHDQHHAPPENVPLISMLPTDALHGVASFVSPVDWACFGQTSHASNRICREIFRRVRLHGFRCATEVITAWKLGEHADARELTALYIKAGVPIYPRCLGHSYHTLTWRMGIEAREMQQNTDDAATQDNGDDASTSTPTSSNNAGRLDRFYQERNETRTLNPTLTYLEEKCHFTIGHDVDTSLALARRVASSSRVNFALPLMPANNDAGAAGGGPLPLPGFRPAAQDPPDGGQEMGELLPPRNTLGLSTAPSFPERPANMPKVPIKVHKHLVDQHRLCRASVDDENGAMQTPPVSLAADFFHPHFPPSPAPPVKVSEGKGPARPVAGTASPNDSLRADEMQLLSSDQVRAPESDSDSDEEAAAGARASPLPVPEIGDWGMITPRGSVSEMSVRDNVAALPEETTDDSANVASAVVSDDAQVETPQLEQVQEDRAPSPPPPPGPADRQDELLETPSPPSPSPRDVPPSVLSNVDLELYTSNSHERIDELVAHLRMRFAAYQRDLDSFLLDLDSSGFEECLLDFWDEFFPLTANIHYFDRHTAVPRLSRLQKFLSQPCPKAIGIVQCEIERIRTSPKKGVNVTGRLFPTYEYRLFIRDRRHDRLSDESSTEAEQEFPRRDTVLISAKNRGKKHMDAAGMIPAPGSSRKGVNNYYMYTPTQSDVDSHHKCVNSPRFVSAKNPNGAYATTPSPPTDTTAPGLLGRLQSNFIGTEFEIYSPAVRKLPAKSSVQSTSGISVESENELDYDSGVSSDNPSSSSSYRRKRRFSRKSTKRRGRMNEPGDDLPGPIHEEVPRLSSSEKRKALKRSRSLPVISYGRSTRTSRRAIAHAVEGDTPDHQLRTVLCEEEEGAITYTANLLGNRPRIMDVCIPKVSSDGVAGTEWRRYLAAGDDRESPSGNRMLSRFKQLQQRQENPEVSSAASDDDGDDEPGSEGDYRPPEDFGLLALQNRPPWWNVELGAFVLNFGGRVNVASVKNFQLCDRANQDYIMLQFGRIQGRHSFTMDFQHPLTAVQAFAIAISSLQSKISFG